MRSSKLNNFSEGEQVAPSGKPGDGAKIAKPKENLSMTPIQEMEKNHSRLEKLVKKRTKELDDVIATNHRFISILGHDLRSPFSTILGVLGLLKESFYDYSETEIEKFIDMAIESANRTLTLLDELLAWSYAQNMGKSISPLKVNLIEVIQAEIMNFSVIAQQKEIILTHTVPSGLNVTADLMMVKTILRNLINNAIKFTPRGGNISITASENSPFVEISVKRLWAWNCKGYSRESF